MKKISIAILAISALILSACSGGGDASNIEGPILDIGQVGQIVIDQFFSNSGLEDEYKADGEFSIYLRDAETGKDMACAAQDDGMKDVNAQGIYYGTLNIPLKEVDGEHPSSTMSFTVVFVEKNSLGCPAPIDSSDTIIGTSGEFLFDGLLGKEIWATNGNAAVVLRDKLTEMLTLKAQAPRSSNGLAIDKLYFEYDAGGDAMKFHIFASNASSENAAPCKIDEGSMSAITKSGITYTALGFPFSCFDPADPLFDSTKVKIGLYVQGESGSELIGETEEKAISALIGEKVPFADGNGYISFAKVVETPFGATVVRIEDLKTLAATSLTITKAPKAASTVELEFVPSSGEYSIACAGEAQGFTGVNAKGTFDNLNAQFAAVDGQKELFGWDKVILRVVERTDGLECPSPHSKEPDVLSASSGIAPAGLGNIKVDLANGGGSATLKISE